MHIETCRFLPSYDRCSSGTTESGIVRLRRYDALLIAKIELTHSIASIHSSCSQGRMRFSAPTSD